MKKILYIITFLLLFPNLCWSQSLDEIYRDIVKSDNDGYLPLFVKNRTVPTFLEDDALTDSQIKKPDVEPQEPIDLTNKRKLRDIDDRATEKKWKETIEAIKLNQITPVELAEVRNRVEENNPKAVEIYAWMLARGVGLQQDLPLAFTMYQKAASLNVPDADKNALIVFKAMNADEKAYLQHYQNTGSTDTDNKEN